MGKIFLSKGLSTPIFNKISSRRFLGKISKLFIVVTYILLCVKTFSGSIYIHIYYVIDRMRDTCMIILNYIEAATLTYSVHLYRGMLICTILSKNSMPLSLFQVENFPVIYDRMKYTTKDTTQTGSKNVFKLSRWEFRIIFFKT